MGELVKSILTLILSLSKDENTLKLVRYASVTHPTSTS